MQSYDNWTKTSESAKKRGKYYEQKGENVADIVRRYIYHSQEEGHE